MFDLPPLHTRHHGWLERPFLFELADTPRMKGVQREKQVAQRIDDIVESGLKKAPPVSVDQSLGMTVVTVNGDPLVTVTPEDVPEYYANLTPDKVKIVEYELASQWADAIRTDLDLQIMMRQPAYRKLAACLAVVLLIMNLIAQFLLSWVGRRFFKSGFWGPRVLFWALYVSVSLALFPEAQSLAYLIGNGVAQPLFVLLLVGTGTWLLYQVVSSLAHRYVRSLRSSTWFADRTRTDQRLAALQQTTDYVLRVAFVFIGLVAYLSSMDVDLSKLATGAGLLGAALGFITQDLVRDVISGAFILVEDQFGVGDWIEWANGAGTVEAFNLRSTQVRGSDGALTTVPNNELRRVKNHSMDWSQVDYRVSVAYKEDADRCLAILLEEGRRLSLDWHDEIIGRPELMGIDELAADGVVLRLQIRTRPLQQWKVKRELNRRIKARYDQENISIPFPQRSVWIENQAAPTDKTVDKPPDPPTLAKPTDQPPKDIKG